MGLAKNKEIKGNESTIGGRALFYMFLLALQFGFQPFLTRRFTPPTICKSSVIVVQEIIKFFLAFSMLVMSGEFENVKKTWSVTSWLVVAAIPAGLYSLQNFAALLAYQNLDGVTFNILNQTKTLSAACCCFIILGKKQSKVQILSLLLLLVAALVIEKIIPLDLKFNQYSYAERMQNTNELSTHHFTHGVVPVLFASFLSGLAGAICQKNLQNSKSGNESRGGRNSFLYSMELCVASTILLLCSLFFSKDGEIIKNHGFWHEWNIQVFIPLFVNAFGGIVVGLVTKYAGSVRKGFALIFGILLSGLAQAFLDKETNGGISISPEQIVGGFIAGISLWLHATNPFQTKSTKLD